jgi:anthranilate phosphoribosyltransferase
MHSILAELLAGRSLSEAQAEEALCAILEGRANESQVGAFLALMAAKGPTVDEIVGGARQMRAHVTPVPVEPDGSVVIDTCGTGGAAKTFNVSTAAAIVAAAAGATETPPGAARVKVAKHGGRSRSGRGSAEVLAALGVNVDASPETQARCLAEAGVCFSFAVNHHPAMKFAAGPRKSLGFPTIFNLLGPLCNPARASRQLMGVYDARYAPLIGEALARLGAERAMVVHGRDGMDEISTTSPTIVVEVRGGRVSTSELDVASLGAARARIEDLIARDLDDAARMVRDVVMGKAGPALEISVVNAGAALLIGGGCADMGSGVAMARRAIASGAAARTLESLARLSKT